MVNSNGWGQGANNNDIGWGQGAFNNSIGWGASHYTSWSGDTDIVGDEGGISYNFQQRVITDSGVYEANSCLVNQLTFLNNINYLPTNYDVNAQEFINASGVTDITTIYAVNDLVISMKADGTWDKMKAIYPFVGGTATTHKFNLKDPRDLDAAFRLTFNGGWTHSSNGVLPNGTNGYANTFLNPSTSLSLNSSHISVYSRTNNNGNYGDIGCSDVGFSNALYVLYHASDLKDYSRNNNSASLGFSTTSSLGYILNNRTTSTNMKVIRNNSIINANTSITTALSTRNIYISSVNVAGGQLFISNRQLAFATIGDGLTDTEASNLYTRVQAFQTTLNRQV